MDTLPEKAPSRRVWLAVFAVVALALLAGGYWYYRYEAGQIRQTKHEEIAAIGKLKAGQIHQWRHERLADANRTAKSPLFRKALEQFLQDPSAPEIRSDLVSRLKLEQTSYGYADVLLLDPQGKILLSIKDDPDPIDPAARDAIERATTTGRAQFSGFYRCPHGLVHLDAVAPILDGQGRPLAVLALHSNARAFLYPLIQSWPTPSESGETLLVRRDGDELIFLTDLRFKSDAALKLREPLTLTTLPAVQAVLGKLGIFEGLDYRGVEVLADLRPVPDSPWFIVSKIDRGEFMAEARYRAGAIAVIVLLFILFAGAVTGFAYRQRQAGLYRELFQSERQIRESEDIFRATLYSIGDGVITTDREGRVRQMNPVAEKLTGRSELDAKGQTLAAVFPIINEETRAEVENPVTRVLREGEVVGLANHTLLIAADGTETPIADSGAPIWDEEGVVKGVVLVFRDQSEERAAQAELAQAEERFRGFFDNAPIGKTMTAPEGRLMRVNPALCDLLGYSAEELQTLSFAAITHPDDLPESRECVRCLLAGEREDYEMDKRYLHKDGHEIWTHVTTRMQRDAQGKPLHFLTHIQDITENKRMELELKEREAFGRSVLDAVGANVCVLDRQGAIVSVNGAWRSFAEENGATSGGTATGTGVNYLALTREATGPSSEGAAEAATGIGDVLAGRREEFTIEYPCHSPDEKRWFMLRVTPLIGGGAVLAHVDITDRKRAEEDLRIKNQVFEDSAASQSIADRDGIITHVNPTFLKMWGYESREQAVGQSVGSFFADPDDAAPVLGALATHDVWQGEFRAIGADGRLFFSRGLATSLRNDQGELIGYQSTNLDVTAEREAEQAVKAALAETRALLVASNAVWQFHNFADAARSIFDAAREATGAQSGYVALLSADGEENEVLFLEAGGLACAVDPSLPMPIRGLRAEAYRQAKVVYENDFMDCEWAGFMPAGHVDLKNVLFAPLVINGVVVGVMGLANKPGDFTEADARLAGALGGIAATSLHRIRSEEALIDSEQRWRQVLTNVPQVGVSLDPEGRITFANEYFLKLTGWKHAEVIDQDWFDLFIPPGIKGQVREVYLDLISRGDASGFSSFENEILTRSGETRNIAWSNVLTRDAMGKIVDVTCLGVDLTDRQRAEAALRESEGRYRDLVENSQDMICAHDLSGNLLSVNEAVVRSLGYPMESVLQMNLRDLIVPKFRIGFDAYLAEIRKEGQAQGIMQIQAANGEVRLWEYNNNLRTEGVPEPTVRGMAHDVTEKYRAEAALARSEEQYRKAQQMGHVGHWEFEPASNTFSGSPEAFRIYGFADDVSVPLEDIVNCISKREADRVLQALFRLISDGKEFNEEFEIYPRNSTEPRTLWSMAQMKKDRQGNPSLVSGVLQDITERKRAEAALKESEERYRIITENMGDTVWLMDMNFKTVYISPSVIRTRGFTLDELQAMPLEKNFTPASMQKVSQAMAEELTPERLADKGLKLERTLELEFTRKDGSFFWSEVTISLVRDAEGQPAGFVGVGRDITERRLAQEELEATAVELEMQNVELRQTQEQLSVSQERYFDLYDLAPTGYLTLSEKGAVLESNLASAALLKREKRELTDKFFSCFVLTEDRDIHHRHFDRLLQTGERQDYELRLLKSDGSNCWAKVEATAGQDIEGRKICRVVMSDISLRKRAEAEREKLETQLRQSQKMEAIAMLAGGVAHDFNNQLTVILTSAGMALKEVDAQSQVHEDLTDIYGAAQRSADLTRQLLAFARKELISPRLLVLNDVVAELLKMLRRLIGEGINLTWKPAAAQSLIKIDPSQLDQILANLAVNARDAMDGQGNLTIQAEEVEFDQTYCEIHADCLPGRYAMLAVSDDGEGMDAETLERLFEPFYTTKETGKGTGLGLATVYGIVHQNHGMINVYSEPGQGTTFKIYLPVVSSEARPAEEVEETLPPCGGETILLVEDEKPILKIAHKILTQFGYQVLSAQTTRDALKIAETHPDPIHLLLTDVVMPEMNGKELNDKIVAILPGIKTVFMSGYTADIIARQGILEDGTLFLQKPFTSRTLTAKVSRALGDQKSGSADNN